MSEIEYKILDKEFVKKGAKFVQIKRIGDIAIYERHKCGVTFEIVKIKRHQGYFLGGNYIKPAETYPSSSTWGTDGFSCSSLERAGIRFQEMLELERMREKKL